MADNVQLNVRSGLTKVIEELQKIRDAAEETQEALKGTGKDVADELDKQSKRTENFMGKLRGFSRRLADQIKGDFRSLLSLNALGDSLKLSNQFRGAIEESIDLGDQIRKLGRTFGLAQGDFSRFQSKITKGLGEIGLGSDVATKTLGELASTTVRGEDNLIAYSKTAGQLASLSGTKGQEGQIAAGIANTIRARGGDSNDLKEVARVAEDLRRVFNQTGKGPAETVKVMETLFARMPQDLRKTFSSAGMSKLAAAAQIGGPNATKFLEDYLSSSPIARKAFEAQGGKGVISDKGIDIEKFRQFSKSIMGRVGGDPRLAAQTLGLSEEAAEGFIRLAESLDKVKSAQDAVDKSSGSVNQQYKESLGLGEAFRANINRVKKVLSGPASDLQQGLTGWLTKMSEGDASSGAVVAGGGLLAALLAGGALKGIGKGMGGKLSGGLYAGAVEGLTGRQVQPVYVVNANEIGGNDLLGAAGAAAKGGGIAAMLGRAGLYAGAATGGYALGEGVVNPLIEKHTQGTTAEGFKGDAMERLFFKLDKLLGTNMIGGSSFMEATKPQKVIVEMNRRDLKESRQPTRGASY